MDDDKNKWEEEVEKRRKAGALWWKVTQAKIKQNKASAWNPKQVLEISKQNQAENENVNDISFPNGKAITSNEVIDDPPPFSQSNENTGKKPIKKDKWVDQVIERMKKYCKESGLYYSKWELERGFAKHIWEQHGEVKATLEREKQTLEGFVKNVIFISSHPFVKEANSPERLYKNYPDILNAWRKMDKIEKDRLKAWAKADTPIWYARTLEAWFREVAIERVKSYEAWGRTMELPALKKWMETFIAKWQKEEYLQRFVVIFKEAWGDMKKLL